MLSFLSNLYNSIPSTIEKDRIQNAVNTQRKFFNDYVLKMLDVEDSLLRDTPTYKEVDGFLKGTGDYKGNPIDYFRALAKKRIKDNDRLLGVAEEIFSSKVLKEALSYDRMNVISYISLCDFFTDYVTGAVSTMVSEAAYSDKDNPYEEAIDKEISDFVKNRNNQVTFSKISAALGNDLKKTIADIKKLDGIEFNPKDENVVQKQYGLSTVDPMTVNFIPVSINPGYWLGQIWNTWVKTKQEWAKEDIKMLQMKIYRLEKLKSSGDADVSRIDKEIQYHSGRLAVLKEELEEIENDS